MLYPLYKVYDLTAMVNERKRGTWNSTSQTIYIFALFYYVSVFIDAVIC